MNAILPPGHPATALFPPASDRADMDDLLTAALGSALARVSEGSVVPTLDMEAFRRELGRFDFSGPRPLGELLSWTIAQLEHGVVHLTHPSYFGLFNPKPALAAECAERIAAAFNPQLASATTSPVPVEIEAHVVRAVARRAGLPASATGHFTTGGSEANFTALICALTAADPAFAAEGARTFAGPPTLYVSADAHQAWHKIVHQAGIGRAALRLVPTDHGGRMSADALSDMLAADRAQGRVPVMIVATAGTTGAGMVDPLVECAEIARRAAAWYHVDAAWGGAAIASDRLRHTLAGIEAADSITIDAHKWFATTMACGMFLTSRAEVPAEAFHAQASFMPSNARHVDPYVTTAQWSRRFIGLRLFLCLATAGWDGYAEHVERSVDLLDQLRRELADHGWTVANDSRLGVLCLDPPEGFPDPASIARAVVASGAAWIASTLFAGRTVVRICVTNGQTTTRDIQALSGLLRNLAPTRSTTSQEKLP